MCTEYHAFESGDPLTVAGHEAAGEVVAVDRATRVKVGDRVVVQPQNACGKCELCLAGTYIHCRRQRDVLQITGSESGRDTLAQFLIKPEWLLTPIPKGMSYDHASMACCGMGPTFGAMQLMEVGADDTVLITGMGPVGLGGVINARYRGARVIGVEGHPYRAELARALGAEAVLDPSDETAVQQVLDLTGGLGADKGIDTSGTPPAKPFLLEAARRTGKVAFVGWNGEVSCSTIIGKGLQLYGAWHYKLQDTPVLMETIAGSAAQIDRLITHTFPLDRIDEAWRLQVSHNCGKVVLHPWE